MCESVCEIAVAYATLQNPCVSDPPSHLLTYFPWEIMPGLSHQSLHGAFDFVANLIRSQTYGITLVHLHAFHFLGFA